MPGEGEQTVLIVDDDRVFADVLGRAMEKRGLKTLVANDLAGALSQAQECLPDLAVVDLKIDRESGLDLLPKLVQLNAQIRMLILTGYSSIATAVAAIKLGAVDYACKPVDADEILGILLNEENKLPGPEEIASQPISVERLQWEHIQKVMEANGGNISATARSLGMHRRTLQRKLQKRPVKR